MWFVPVLLTIWVCGAQPVHACSCTPRSTTCGPPGEYWRASDVFTARVVSIGRGNHPTERRVDVLITKRWRGTVGGAGSRVDVFTRSSRLCGYPFKTGREYLIYGSRTEDGRLATSTCSRTAPLEAAIEDVNYARNAVAGIVPAGRIVGDVRLKTTGRRHTGIPNVRVLVSHAGNVLSTLTDAQGRYEINVTSAGRYEVGVTLPETHYAVQTHQIIEVPHADGCVERHVDVLFNGRIAGRVTDANGGGVAGLPVTHIPLQDRLRREKRTSVLTRDDGSYEIARLPPGPFEVRVELPVDVADRLPRLAADAIGSTVTEGVLGGGERLVIDTSSLPRSMDVIRLEGRVVGADGWSMADARVFLKGDTGERLLGVPAITDALGRFVLAVSEGEPYQVFAERPSDDSEFSDPVSITAERGMAPLRLIVRRRF